MRILLLAQFYPPVIGGEERHVHGLATGLAARGHDVHVATLDVEGWSAGDGALPDDPGVTVHRLDNVGRRAPSLYPTADRPLALPVPDPLTSRALARVAAEVRPDVVHSHNWLVSSWLPLPAAARVPLVHSLHDYGHVCATKRLMKDGEPCSGPSPRKCLPCSSQHYGGARGAAIWAAVRGAAPLQRRRIDLLTPVSRAVAEGTRLAQGDVPWEVVPNFVPDELVDRPVLPRHDGLPRAPYAFFAGDLTAQKGVTDLLAAWSRRTAAPTAPWELLLVGRASGDLPDPLPTGVRVAHGWAHERVVAAFQHAAVAVLPSAWPDPCPTTVLEAMALGAPLVTTHRGGIADMVVDERSALVVPPRDPAALAAALDRLGGESGPALADRLRAGARDDVRPFLRSAVVAQLESAYERVVATQRAAARGAGTGTRAPA